MEKRTTKYQEFSHAFVGRYELDPKKSPSDIYAQTPTEMDENKNKCKNNREEDESQSMIEVGHLSIFRVSSNNIPELINQAI